MPKLKTKGDNLSTIGRDLVAHSKTAEFSATRGLVVELFPFIHGASERLSARAISRFLEKERGIKLSAVTVTKALNDPRKYWNLYFDTVEGSARTFLKMDKMPLNDFLFQAKYFIDIDEKSLLHKAIKVFGKAEIIQAAHVLREKWFCIDLDIRLKARPYIEHRLAGKGGQKQER